MALCAGLLAGCGSEEVEPSRRPPPRGESSTTFEQGSARVALPSGFVPLPAEEERAMIATLTRGRRLPASYRFAGRRLRDRRVLVVLQHETTPLVAHGGENAGDFLSEALTIMLHEGHGEGAPAAERRRDGGVEQCVESDVRGLREHTCLFASIDAEAQAVALETVSCVAEPAERDLCRRVMESRAYAPSAPLPLTTTLEATASPGLPEIGRDHVLWVRFGMSREEFQAACRSAGERADDVDLTREPPMVRAWFREGIASKCSGLGAPLSLGEATSVTAFFHPGGGLAEVHVRLSAPLERTEAAMRAAYPDWMPDGDTTAHFVDRGASGYQVFGITTAPSAFLPARSMIVVQTRAALDRPPI